MSEHYNTSYSKEEIAAILQKIQDCVRAGKYTIAQNEKRAQNQALIREYNLRTERQRHILLQIEPEDFCHSLQNTNIGFEHEVLYVFCPQVILFNFHGEEKQVDIYTKFNIIDLDSGSLIVVISFHERNKPMDYLFR
ncbi:hypothetical protein Sgly_1188 [Syntrophobotulus glycolicus DSM 8271]|uniref:Uncharacterized protein n=1 Tax=Syntrophobotulus glycolicus (strain DSM 8271 / FlGlyR) TaxID=645991 RepID=F0SUL3_SYNGF|nr:hypothetical protein [Syntrophobotulus glycolicus]ADY55506.1 hypothetical protein Sgly_1188 [Syntrophobotulus glycolicus DSM 8271]